MAIPLKYQRSAHPSIASYNWQDLAEGTGVVNYKLYTTTDSDGDDYIMGTQTLYSSKISSHITVLSTHTDFTKLADLDFDLSAFNLPKEIRGTAILQFGHKAKSVGTVNAQLEAYSIIRLKKNDVEIASVQTETLQPPANGGEDFGIVCLKIPITTKTHFEKGDILRATLEMWGKAVDVGANSGDYWVGHDPINRDETGAIEPSTQDNINTFDIYVPYDIDK